MSDLVKDALGDGFIELRCCGQSAGFINARPFTPATNERFCAIQQKLGNAWTEDAEAKALVADPESHGPPPDGTPIMFPCNTCGAKFVWAGGRPVKISST